MNPFRTTFLLGAFICSVSSEECMHCIGEDYRGNISTTENGFICQRWDSQKPHEHEYKPENYPANLLEENYCRNTGGEPRPWCYTTSPNKRWDYCSIPRCTSAPPTITPELTCMTGRGRAYRGTISVTEGGRTCQMWSAMVPHEHRFTLDNYPCQGLRWNYCRNPDNQPKPWCYTTDPDIRWQYCDVPRCDSVPDPEECMHCIGEDYRGNISTTENGFICQRWDSQKPHEHEYKPENYPANLLEENYCRNTGGEPRPWCYTTSPNKRWDYCSIPRCTSAPPTITPELTCMTGRGRAYRGTISVTEGGRTCQMWSAMVPHEHRFTLDNYPCQGLRWNYCRNPDNQPKPWCYTTDPDIRWQYCDVPRCDSVPDPEKCMHCIGEDYRGKISTTENGFICQRWDSQKPHEHEYKPENYPANLLEENYCRNTGGEPRPWCYTTSPNKRWDYCSIPRCTSAPPTITPELTCMTGRGRAYRGTISVTEGGRTCQMWSAMVPHEHRFTLDNYPCQGLRWNYCRNPDNQPKPWCYTTDPDIRWQYCDVPRCDSVPDPEECMHCIGEDYRGNISTTENGFICQRWDSQKPHEHEYKPENYPANLLEENYCRNTGGEPRPWCYTTSPNKRWDYCSIPRCTSAPPTITPELTCMTGRGRAYRGTISVTEGGRTCQMWSAMVPHEHRFTLDNYPCQGLRWNYCRNPDNQPKPWCYTTDPDIRWQYCDVPRCDSVPDPEECMHCIGEDYRGNISTTENGFICQRWDSQKPHEHEYKPENYPANLLEENYCRNTGGEPRPWCYTTSPNKRWDYCSIPRCTSAPPTITPELTCMTGRGRAYRGTISVTEGGRTCQMWSAMVPHEHRFTLDNYPCQGLRWNYCRNPDNQPKPWCYTTDPDIRWQYCDVPRCDSVPDPEKIPGV